MINFVTCSRILVTTACGIMESHYNVGGTSGTIMRSTIPENAIPGNCNPPQKSTKMRSEMYLNVIRKVLVLVLFRSHFSVTFGSQFSTFWIAF